jgi:EmrB/QacA subfamily drug resistance transporter
MRSGDLSKADIKRILASLMITLLLSALDSTIVGTAMPRIVSDLHGIEHYSWPFAAYMLSSTLAIIVFGRISDMVGRKPVFLFGICFFLFSSALCGLSRSMFQLSAFRGLQGMGGGVLVSSAFIIVGELFSPRERGKYMGLLASMFGFASVLGPVLGGFITDHFSWRFIFYINVPLGCLAFFLVVSVLPHFAPVTESRKVDYPGIVILFFALLSLFLALSWAGSRYPWLSPQIAGLVFFSALMFILLSIVEPKAEVPLLPGSLFRNPVFMVSIAAMFLANAVMFCGIVYVPLFAQTVIGVSATKSGIITTPMMLSLVASAIAAGRLISRSGRYKPLALASFTISATSLFLLLRMDTATPIAHVIAYAALFGAGCGLAIPSFNVAAQNAFPHRQLALVSSSMQFFRNMGATVGISIFGFVMNSTLARGFAGLDLSGVPPQLANAVVNPRMLSNPEGLSDIRIQTPPTLLPLFDELLGKARTIMADSLHWIFAVGLAVALLSLLITLALRELPLRRDNS